MSGFLPTFLPFGVSSVPVDALKPNQSSKVLLDIAKALQAALLFIPSVRALTTFSRKNSGYVFIIHQNNMLLQYIVSYKQMIAIVIVRDLWACMITQRLSQAQISSTQLMANVDGRQAKIAQVGE